MNHASLHTYNRDMGVNRYSIVSSDLGSHNLAGLGANLPRILSSSAAKPITSWLWLIFSAKRAREWGCSIGYLMTIQTISIYRKTEWT